MNNHPNLNNPLYGSEPQDHTQPRFQQSLFNLTNSKLSSVEETFQTQIFVPKPKGYFALYYIVTNPLNNEDTIILMTKFFDSEIYLLIQSFSKKFAQLNSKIFCLELDIEDLKEYATSFTLPNYLSQRNSQALKNTEDDLEKSDLINSILNKEISKLNAKIELLKGETTPTELLKLWNDQLRIIQNNLILTTRSDLDLIYHCALFRYNSISKSYFIKLKKDRILKKEKKLKFKEEKAKKELESSAPAIISIALFEKTIKELEKLKIQLSKKVKEPSNGKRILKQKPKKVQTKSKENPSANLKPKKDGPLKKKK